MGLSTSSLVVLYGAQLPAFWPDLLVAGLSTGLVGSGILDRLRAEEGEEAEEDPLLDDGGLGGDDLDDDFGDLRDDDWDDDPFGGGDEGDGEDTVELANRVDELENEVDALSSTVGTVRGESEQISESVEDVEEDIRQLLDIYELVTRGINPFVDDFSEPDGAELDGGSFGLFEAGGDDGGPLAEDDVDASEDEGDASAQPTGATTEDTMAPDDTTNGRNFDDLKAEYDAYDAGWAVDGSTEPPASNGAVDEPSNERFDEDVADDEVHEAAPETFGSDPARAGSDGRPGTGPSRGRAAASNGHGATGGFNFLDEDDVVDGPQRPYLKVLPGEYVTDLLVMEWLEFLVNESTVTDTGRALNYYHRIGWIAEPVAADLHEFLTGFGDVDLNRVTDPGCEQLGPEHHQESLEYVMQLSQATAETLVVGRWDALSGVGRGI